MTEFAEFIVGYAKVIFGINFFVAGLWITAILWFKAARVFNKLTKE